MIYQVTYYRHDKKSIETKSVDDGGMVLAVQKIINTAKQHDVKISSISCTIDGSKGVQRFCDYCHNNEALFGYKDKTMKCKECIVLKESKSKLGFYIC
jgi:hypothetical protein